MKIAIPTKADKDGAHIVDNHFGHCEFYTVLTLDGKAVASEEQITAPKGCGCKSNIANELADKGVKVLLAGSMGQGAVNKLDKAGIETIRGFEGSVRDVFTRWQSGDLPPQTDVCDHDHGEDGHECPSQVKIDLKPMQ